MNNRTEEDDDIDRKFRRQDTCRDPGFDSFWTQEMEARLQRTWTDVDDAMVAKSHAKNEEPFWATFRALYGVDPPEVLPPIDCTRTRSIYKAKDGKQYFIWNWPQDVCIALSGLLKCPLFQNNLAFLRYTLWYTIRLRLGTKYKYLKTSTDRYYADFATELLTDIANVIDDPAVKADLMDTVDMLANKIGKRDLEVNSVFLHTLKDMMKPKANYKIKGTTGRGLMIDDLNQIRNSWEKVSGGNLSACKLHIKGSSKGTLPEKRSRRDPSGILRISLADRKKAYILHRRRESWKGDGKWRRGVKALYSEATPVDGVGCDDEDEDETTETRKEDHDDGQGDQESTSRKRLGNQGATSPSSKRRRTAQQSKTSRSSNTRG